MMKFTAIFLLAVCLNATANGYAQRVSISEQNAPLEKVFREIKKQTGYTFVYREALIKKAKKVSIQINNASIEQVLNLCLQDQPLAYSIVNKMVVIKEKELLIIKEKTSIPPPPPTIQGKITNDKGEPLVGASVQEKGTSNATLTKEDGSFTITVSKPDAVLVVSYVGYDNKEIPVNNQTSLSISLVQKNNNLSDVVVVGYGTQRKKDITGSVVSVNEKTLDEVPANNLTMALQGRAAGVDIARTGVRPGSGGQIRIRGNRSLSSSNEPLIVLDGFVYQGSINDLNTDDIANIDILKDASATAVYGSRGSNGVIIITTKRGRTGKPAINYSGTVGMTSIINQYPVFNAEEYYAFKSESRYGAGNATAPAVFTPAELEGKANGINTNWQDLLYKKGLSTSHDLNVSGGTELTQYGLGVSYLNQEGVIPTVGFERYGLRATIDQKIGKRIKIGLNTLNTLTYTDGDNVNPMFVTLALSPLVSPYNPDGSVNIFPMVGHQDVGARLNPLTLETPNAVLDRRRRLRTFNTLYAELQILEGLKYRFNAGLDFRQDNYGAYYAANTILSFASNTPFISNTAQTSNGEAWMYDIYHQLTYDKVIGDKHRLNATALYEVQQDQSTSSDFTGTGIPADYMQNTNFSRLVSAISAPASGNNFTKSGILSYMGRINYTFNNRYSFTATVRRDGSSRLAEGNKWFTYPALGVSWSASDETFLQSVNWLSTLKLRAGWGKTANQAAAPYSTLGGLSTNNYSFGPTGFVTGYYVGSLPNPNLGWENTEVTNVAVDFGLLNNRISGSVDIYKTLTKDIIVNKQLPISNGASSVTTNAAKTESKGIELTLSTINIDSKSGFRWSSDINWSLNREKIVELEEPGKLRDEGNGWFVGSPLTVIYDYQKIGIWQEKDAASIAQYGGVEAVGRIRVADLTGDNKITSADRTILGSFQPKWQGGITNRFNYKNFDLSAVTFARWGTTIVANYLYNGYSFFNEGRVNQWKIDYWSKTNPTNDFPQPNGQAPNSNYFTTLRYHDGSFIRVRSINFGYTLPAKWISRAGINATRLYVSVTNPFILYSPFVSDGYGIDPEGTATSGRSIIVDTDIPPSRQFIFGVNIKL